MPTYNNEDEKPLQVDLSGFFWWEVQEIKVEYYYLKRQYENPVKRYIAKLLKPLGINLKKSKKALSEEHREKISSLSARLDGLANYAVSHERIRLNTRIINVKMDMSDFQRNHQ